MGGCHWNAFDGFVSGGSRAAKSTAHWNVTLAADPSVPFSGVEQLKDFD